jgi:hypothetical protein
LGNGADGDLVVSGTYTVDSVKTSLAGSVVAGTTSLQVTDATGLAVGDEVLVISMQGLTAPGAYEFQRVASLVGNTVGLTAGLNHAYNVANDQVVVQRVPNFGNVTVQSTGTLTSSAWNGTMGGIVAFRATGTVHVESTADETGRIGADALGFRGGPAVIGQYNDGYQGESYRDLGGRSKSPNEGGGGAGWYGYGDLSGADWGGGGGGGGHGTAGGDGEDGGLDGYGRGGLAYAVSNLSLMYLGSGGGWSGGTVFLVYGSSIPPLLASEIVAGGIGGYGKNSDLGGGGGGLGIYYTQQVPEPGTVLLLLLGVPALLARRKRR